MVEVGSGLAERMLQVGTDVYWLEDSELQVMYCEEDGLMTDGSRCSDASGHTCGYICNCSVSQWYTVEV